MNDPIELLEVSASLFRIAISLSINFMNCSDSSGLLTNTQPREHSMEHESIVFILFWSRDKGTCSACGSCEVTAPLTWGCLLVPHLEGDLNLGLFSHLVLGSLGHVASGRRVLFAGFFGLCKASSKLC